MTQRVTRDRSSFAPVLFAALFLFRAADAAAVSVPSGQFPTIQSAIDAVVNGTLPDATTIEIAPGTYFEALFVGNTNRSMTIRGLGGAGATVVDASGRNAAAINVFQASGQVVFRDLTFRHGSPPAGVSGGGFVIQSASPSFIDCIFEANSAFNGGGGTLIASNATFTDCVIRNNSAVHFGGGVFIVSGSRPVFQGCDITGNVSGTATNDGAGGGVFALDASPTIRGSRISSNTSRFAAGGIFQMGVFGSPFGASALLVEDSEIADNVSIRATPADNPSEGGGVHVEDNASASLTRTRVLRNTAGTGGGLNAYRARYDVVDSVIDSNRSNANEGFGGGIAATSNFASASMPASVVNLTRTLVRNNLAIAADGSLTGKAGGVAVLGIAGFRATLTLTASVVDNNQSSSQGGGILVSQGNLTVSNSIVLRNSVSGGAVPFGGGIMVDGGGGNASATITQSTISQNSAGSFGGGLFFNSGVALNISATNVYANTAGLRGPGIFSGTGQSGLVQGSIIADNTSPLAGQINEDSCNSTLYQNNTITPLSGSVLFSGCATIGTRVSGTNSVPPRFAHFLAVPGAGTSSTLVWSVGRATSVTIAGVGTFNGVHTGSADVAPPASTTYTLTAAASGPNGGAYSPVNATFTVVTPPTTPTSSVKGDFDGDDRSDISVFRPSDGTWYIVNSSTGVASAQPWGNSADVPVPGDYNGDGRVDAAVFRPSNGTWYVWYSGTSTTTGFQWGNGSDKPVPADYDGDGKTDLAVFRPSDGTWYVVRSSNGTAFGTAWGNSSDKPAPGDYDGDGKADIAVFRPSNGTWFIVRSSTGIPFAQAWGSSNDIPVPGDYDGDGKTDIAVFRPSDGTWYVIQSSTGFAFGQAWGNGSDIPVPGDYDGDGKTDIAVFRPSNGTWYVIQSTTGLAFGQAWGNGSDIPLLKAVP